MPFVRRFNEIQKKVTVDSPWKVWFRALTFSIFILLLVFLYDWVFSQNLSLRLLNDSVADAGMILIGLSFILSAVCYFWNFADTKIIYRKDLGLFGFYMEVIHGAISFFFNPRITPQGYIAGQGGSAFVFAAISLGIFFIMALISNKYAIHELGGVWWRRLLRVGYVAYLFGIFHMGIRGWDGWILWFNQIVTRALHIPPFSLIIVVFGMVVLGFRIALSIDIHLQKKKINNEFTNATPLQTAQKK